MSSRYDHGSHFEKHPKAAELRSDAAHAHETGELHGKQDHATASEQSHHEFERVHDGQPHVKETTVGLALPPLDITILPLSLTNSGKLADSPMALRMKTGSRR